MIDSKSTRPFSTDHVLNPYLAGLKRCFKGADRHSAHQNAAPILVEMAKDRSVLHAVLRNALDDPAFLQQARRHALIAFPIDENSDFTLVTNCFLPLPDRSTNVSHESIHHHGNLLLTTVAVFGEGYESFLFKKDFRIDRSTGEARMQLEKLYTNHLHHVAFIDSYTPHVVFFPRQLSITYALWSTNKRSPFDRVRRTRTLQYFKEPIIRFIRAIGASKLVGVNVVEDFDFYPQGTRIRIRHDRADGYPKGTTANFIQNVFHILQQVGFDDRQFLESMKARCLRERPEAVPWINALMNDDRIPDLYEPSHVNIEKVHFRKEDLLAVLN